MVEIEIKITVDRLEESDAFQLVEMFKIMCAFSDCTYSTRLKEEKLGENK